MVSRNDLALIDFSECIKDDEINTNFANLNEQIKKERLAVGGSGIMSGLNLTANNNKLTVSSGSVVDINGDKISFDSIVFDVNLPVLMSKTETLQADAHGNVALTYTPYASTRLYPSQYDLTNSGVTAVDADNTARSIVFIGITDNIVSFDAKLNANKNITVTYSYALKRYDLVYIDNNYDISIMQGLSSNSPSLSKPNNYKYLLGYYLVDPYFIDSINSNPHAGLSITKDYDNTRNIYTDDNNNLYIKGVPFSDLQIIHMEEPEKPDVNTLWYDCDYNKLKVYRVENGIGDWELINDVSVIPVMEYCDWTYDYLDVNSKLPSPANHDLQTFLFSQLGDETALRMKFFPGKNELEVLIDNTPLMHDQYTEIIDTDSNSMYQNQGIGFKLTAPLDHAADIEARVVHRVWEDPGFVRFKRSATFVYTNNLEFNTASGTTITTSVPYRFNENQLEVFINGVRLDTGKDFTEGTDLPQEKMVTGTYCYNFTLTNEPLNGSKISYKISTTIYSYDHINDLLGNLNNRIQEVEESNVKTVQEVKDFEATVNTDIDKMQKEVDAASKAAATIDNKLNKDDVLTIANMPASINKWVPKAIINRSVQFLAASGTLNIPLIPSGDINMYPYMTDVITPNDYVQVFDMNTANGSVLLRRKDGTGSAYDYDIKNIDGTNYLVLANNNIVQDKHNLYITGINFSMEVNS